MTRGNANKHKFRVDGRQVVADVSASASYHSRREGKQIGIVAFHTMLSPSLRPSPPLPKLISLCRCHRRPRAKIQSESESTFFGEIIKVSLVIANVITVLLLIELCKDQFLAQFHVKCNLYPLEVLLFYISFRR